MAVKFNNAEGGTNGNTVTTADTNSGDAWNNVTSASATVQWDNTHTAHGSMAIKYATGGSSVPAYTAWTGLSIARIRFRFNVFITATPTVTLVGARGLAASAQKFRMGMETDGKLHIRDNSNTSLATSTTTLPTNQWFRIEGDVTAGTSAAYEIRLYTSVDSTTITETLSGSAANFGSANFDEIRFGEGASFSNAPAFWLDDMGISDSGFMGPALKTGTAAGALGGLAGTAASQRTVLATASGPLGVLAGTAASKRTVLATAAAALGALSGSATGRRTVFGSGAAPLGGLIGAATGQRQVLGTALGGLGGLAGTALGRRTALGAATANLGALTGSAASQRTVLGLAAAGLGGLTGHADGHRLVLGTASGPLGVLVGSAVGVAASRLVTRPNTGTVTRPDTGLVTRPDTGIVTRP